VPDEPTNLSIQLGESETNILVARMSVALDVRLDAAFDPNFRHSFISPQAHRDLQQRGLIFPAGPRTFLLRDLILGGTTIPDMTVRVSSVADVFGVECVLAADFFGRFARWFVDRDAGLLILGRG